MLAEWLCGISWTFSDLHKGLAQSVGIFTDSGLWPFHGWHIWPWGWCKKLEVNIWRWGEGAVDHGYNFVPDFYPGGGFGFLHDTIAVFLCLMPSCFCFYFRLSLEIKQHLARLWKKLHFPTPIQHFWLPLRVGIPAFESLFWLRRVLFHQVQPGVFLCCSGAW